MKPKVRMIDSLFAVPPNRLEYETKFGGHRYAVRKGYVLRTCDGEAHRNIFLSTCPRCTDHSWGVLAEKEPV